MNQRSLSTNIAIYRPFKALHICFFVLIRKLWGKWFSRSRRSRTREVA